MLVAKEVAIGSVAVNKADGSPELKVKQDARGEPRPAYGKLLPYARADQQASAAKANAKHGAAGEREGGGKG
eukprot:3964410-Pyramimonas_sp.AAC.1